MWVLGPTLIALAWGAASPALGLGCAGRPPGLSAIRLVRADPPASLAILLCRAPAKPAPAAGRA